MIQSDATSTPVVSKSRKKTTAGPSKCSTHWVTKGRAWNLQKVPPRRSGSATSLPRSSVRRLQEVMEHWAPFLVTPEHRSAIAFPSHPHRRVRVATPSPCGPSLSAEISTTRPSHLGHQHASKTCTLSQKVGRKHVPLSRKSTSKPFIIWDTKMRQKRVPLARKSVENAYP